MEKEIELSIIYVYYNTPLEILRSVESVKKTIEGIEYEVIIVDNNSIKKVPPKVKGRRIKVIKNKINVGFGAGCNLGARTAKGKYLLFINPDTEAYPGSIKELLLTVSKKGVGVVGPKMLDSRGITLPTISSFISFPQLLVVYSFFNTLIKKNPISSKFWLYEVDREKEQKVDVISGACLILRRSVFGKIGGFDERFFMYFEEHDLCFKVQKLGLTVIFNPKAKIMHLIGRSLTDKKKIKSYFQKSRYLYMKKHYGLVRALLSELILRFFTSTNLFALFIFSASLFINTYRQNQLMLLIGDGARDFLAARDMILTHTIPLVGIPSSVTWLHQGPISVYGIGLSFFVSNFNPVAPGIFFGLLGAFTTVLLFKLVNDYFGEKTAMISTALFATSPMVVVNARMPYHTSLIPLFTVIFFLILLKALHNQKYIPALFLAFGLLLQVELSNIVVLAITGCLFFVYKVRISKKIGILSTIALFVGVLPFILYEFANGPAYIKFPLWIANRVRLFFGLTLNHQSTTSSLPNAFTTIYQQISGMILPHIHIIGLFIFLVALLYLFIGSGHIFKKKASFTVFLWVVIPLSAFLLHASPGTAYFGLLYPAVLIIVGLLFETLIRSSKFFIWVLGVIIFLNISLLFTSDFFVSNKNGAHPMPPTFYNFGSSWSLSDDVSKAIVIDAGGRSFSLTGKAGLAMYKTSIDPFVYLAWYHGGNISEKAALHYEVYPLGTSNIAKEKVIFKGEGGVVVKNE